MPSLGVRKIIRNENLREISRLGVPIDRMSEVRVLSNRHDHLTLRIKVDRSCLVAKIFPGHHYREILIYRILREAGVPTITVLSETDRSLLLEDLESSEEWRLGVAPDLSSSAAGTAIARWYRKLHESGQHPALQCPNAFPWEGEVLSGETIMDATTKLDLRNHDSVRLAIARLPDLKAAYQALPQTLTHNDFYWTNLALRRDMERAVMFDYHVMGTGNPASDCRNVLSSLKGAAAQSFKRTYGPVDCRAAILDEPLAVLYSLVAASERESLPGWARPIIDAVRSGEFACSLHRALRHL